MIPLKKEGSIYIHDHEEGCKVTARVLRRVYTVGDMRQFKLKGKPKCPYCEKPVSFVYDDIPHGHISQICPTCGHKVLLDVGAMTAHKIEGQTSA